MSINYSRKAISIDSQEKFEISFEISKFGIIFFLSIILRVYKKEFLFINLHNIKSILKDNIRIAVWFIDICIHPKILDEFVFDCPFQAY